MAHQNSQQNNNYHGFSQTWDVLTPPTSAAQNNSQQQLSIHGSNNTSIISLQLVSFISSGSYSSTQSRSTEEKIADELFDKMEDMLCDYMRQPNRHYLHCRVLRWSLDEDDSRLFSAVIVINPPTTRN